MHFAARCLLSALILCISLQSLLFADAAQPESGFSSFTGKITRNKVRLRLQPNLDGQILKELSKDDLLVVLGEEEEFYAVAPPRGTKSYIYRTYVLDNTVEGSRINVRLEPDTESPVIAQLNTGDKVDGVISPLNSKWLEITPPASARFFVCKEYIENVGDAKMISTIEKRQEEVNTLLSAANLISQAELAKPFEQTHIETALSHLNKIIQQFPDFPHQTARAKELLTRIQNEYAQKKIAYLEARTAHFEKAAQYAPAQSLANDQTQTLVLSQADSHSHPAPALKKAPDWNQSFDDGTKTPKMLAWVPVERDLYETWSLQHDIGTLNNYYTEQNDEALIVRGLIEPYYRAIRNKPGDYILVSKATNLPIAYLYSIHVDLEELIGKEVTMRVSPRPNNHFAFPAYFVLALE